MFRLLFLLFLLSAAIRKLSGRWPWEMLVLPQGKASSARARMLLGVDDHATHSDIIDAHRRLIVRVHPDRGGTESLVYEANAARDLLLAELGQRDTGRRNKE